FGRIVTIADVFDALISKRAYKESWGEERSLEEMIKAKAAIFDPELLDHFLLRLPLIRQIRERYKEKDAAEAK
ncbi:MAG: hypothetical protein COX51_02475, partial [Syntrophobacteraceae bacterium CG23_combo_of_CG06-09_8_20_14_all_50_8]